LGGPSPGVPLFSVIVLNWNGRHLLEECLESVLSQTFSDFETIVVDNGSEDGSIDLLQGKWKGDIKLVILASNIGFAGGNNAGMREAKGKFVILLNNDTVVDSGWLSALRRAISHHPEAGMFTPKILNYYRRDEIDNTGHLIYPDGLARGHNRLEKNDGRFDKEREALYPSGCAGVYRKEMLDGIGLLDETFFAYGPLCTINIPRRPGPTLPKKRFLPSGTVSGSCSGIFPCETSWCPLFTRHTVTPYISWGPYPAKERRASSPNGIPCGVCLSLF